MSIFHSRAIVLHQLKFSDTSLIVKMYTPDYGMLSFIARGARKARARIGSALLQAGNLLEIQAYYKPTKELQYLKEVHVCPHYDNIPFNVVKTTILLFYNEIAYKCIREQEANPDLFEFLFQQYLKLDSYNASMALLPLRFLWEFSSYLGFTPMDNYSRWNTFFDLREGCFSSLEPSHPDFIAHPLSNDFHQLLNGFHSNTISPAYSSEKRFLLLETMLQFYQVHIQGFVMPKSHHVLREILHA